MEKIRRGKSISIVLMLMMVIQLMMPVNLAYAADGDITETVAGKKLSGSVTVINPDTGEIISPLGDTYNNVPENALIKLKYDFELPFGDGYEFNAGDFIKIKLPEGIEFKTPLKSQILDGDGVLVANYEIKDGHIIVTFTEYVEEHSKVVGYLNVEGTFVKSGEDPVERVTIDVKYKGHITIVFEKEDTPTNGAKIEKSGEYDHNDGDGTITWTVIVTPDDELENVTIIDKFSSNQVYVEGSFSDITSGAAVTITGAAIIGNKITYKLDNLSGVRKFQFKTKPTYTAFAGETGADENTDAVRFINEAEVLVNGNKTDDDKAGVSVDWIEKFGVFNKNTKEIEWTIHINNEGYDIKNAVITDTIPKGLIFEDGSAKITKGATTNPIDTTKSGEDYRTLTFKVGDLDGLAVLKYNTKVDNYEELLKNNDGTNFKNDATLNWENNKFGTPSDYDSVGVVGQGGILNKYAQSRRDYDDNKNIVWTIQVNRNRAQLDDVVSFTDKIPAGLGYVDGSLKIVSSTDTPIKKLESVIYNITYSASDNTLKFTFIENILKGHTYIIQYETEVVDKTKLFVNGDVSFTNNATVTGSAIIGKAAGEDTQTFSSQIISKSRIGNYDYKTREVEWQIVVNRNKLTLPNAMLTDEIPEGMEYVKNSFSVSSTGASIKVEPSVDGRILTYEFGEIKDTYTVKFKTRVTDEGLETQGTHTDNKNLRFTNEATISSTGFEPKSATADVDVKNPIVEKSGKMVGDYVKWRVNINTNSIKINELVLSDSLDPAFTLEVESVKLYTATGTAISLTEGSIVPKEKYVVSYDKNNNNTFTFSFETEINNPYILEFITSVSKDVSEGKKIENSITLEGVGSKEISTGNSTSVQINRDDTGGSGETGKITITKVDKNDTEKRLSGAKFKIYTLNKNGTYGLVGEVTTSPDGKIIFTRSGSGGSIYINKDGDDGTITFDKLLYKTHYIEEIDAPEGYLRDPEVKAFVVFDANERTYTFENEKIYGDIKFTKLNESNEPLAGAKFELFAKGDEGNFTKSIGTVTSKDDGSVLFENIEAGSYQIREISAPTGYIKSEEVIDVTVGRDASQTKVVVTLAVNGEPIGKGFKNELVEVSAPVLLYKEGVDKKNNGKFNLAGAEFTLYEYKGGVVGDPVGQPAISQEDGKVSFAKIPEGTYVVIETEAPYGYAKSDSEVFVNIFRNPDKLDEALVEYGFENDAEFASEILTVENQKLFADIAFTKVDEGGKKGLAGAKFKLTKDSDSNWGPKFAESDENGKVIFEHIELGKYTIEETESPIGYVKLTDKIHVTVDYNKDKTAAVVKFTINDDGMQFEDDNVYVGNELVDVYKDAKLIKNGVAENSKGETLYTKALKDAKFDIYLLSENGESHFDSSTSEENGSVTFSKLPIGNYVIKETEAPTGYLKTNEEVFVKVYRNPDKLDEALVSYWLEGQEPASEEITVINKSINIELKKTNTSGNPLAGAEFTLFDLEENAVQGFEPVTSNEFGEVIFTAVPEGNYIIKETKAPNGYREYNKKISAEVMVTESEAVVNFLIDGEEVVLEDGVLTVENERKPGGGGETPVYGKIAIKKVDENKKVLQGAEFTLNDSNGKVVGKAVSGKDGIVSFENLEKGNYVIKETKAPDGYVFEVNETEVEIKGSETKTYTFTNKKEEPKKPGRIEIIKTDEEGNLLSDAWFSLIDEKGSTLQNVVTVNGRAAFEDVPAGRYTVKEVKAPAGYELSEKTVSVTVGSEETITVKFVNKLSGVPVVPVSGKITINKVDENNMALSGAEFTLYNENNEVLGTAVSDENGRVIFENLKDGKYFVRETKAPEGYEIVTDVLNVDVAQGKSYSYRFRNIPSSEIIRDPNVPKGWETIEDPDVPADTVPTLPDTGSFLNTWVLAAIGFMFILTGIILYKRRMLRN